MLCPLQGAIDFDGGPIVSDAAAEAVASVQPLPLVVADERFPVSLARLVRTTLQPEAPFIQRHFGNMGYWATVIEPWALDTGALPYGPMAIEQLPACCDF